MRYLSVCSGIEAATVAWSPLGWKAAAFSEIEPFPSAVLAHHYPQVPNLGDMTNFRSWPDAAFDVLAGGTPCQSFSVAGLRAGMADPRGNLLLVYLAILERYRPRWMVWENVPGVLSSGGGRDFGAFLGGLAQLGYGFAYRILDAQFFGLAQRRRRVFVVGYLGNWRLAAAVLFERSGLSGDPSPRRKAGEKIAPSLAGCSNGGGANGPGRSADDADSLIPALAGSLTSSSGRRGGVDDPERGGLFPALANTLTARMFKGINTTCDEGQTPIPVAFNAKQDPDSWEDRTGPLATDGGQQAFARANAVRRLTPRECERLQGFPDDYTRIIYRNKPAADGPRYKALGNSMAVPVMAWIGRRIALVEQAAAPRYGVDLASGPDVTAYACGTCGTLLAFEGDVCGLCHP